MQRRFANVEIRKSKAGQEVSRNGQLGRKTPSRAKKRKTLSLPKNPRPLPPCLKLKESRGPVRILLNGGHHALVDIEDADRIARFNWTATTINAHTQYARCANDILATTHRLMHRLILSPTTGEIVDHINGNGLDNRRENLRLVSAKENAQNKFLQDIKKTSRFKGVHRSAKRWVAGITVDGQRKALGVYTSEILAAKAYDDAALEFFGEFARTNEMMGLYPGQTPYERNGHSVIAPVRKTPIRMVPGDEGYDWKRLPPEGWKRPQEVPKMPLEGIPEFYRGVRVRILDGHHKGETGIVRHCRRRVVRVTLASGDKTYPAASLERV